MPPALLERRVTQEPMAHGSTPLAAGLVPALGLPLFLAQWLSSGSSARMVCDASQRILWHCPKLERLVEGGWTIKLERSQFTLGDKRAQAALTGFINKAATPETAIGLMSQDGRLEIVLQCQRLDVPPLGTAFGLRFVSAQDWRENDLRHFEQYFGLTRQEAAVCRHLLQGRTVPDIVAMDGKSPDTIRFHVRNLYHKVEVSSREALFARLRLFLFG